MGVTEGSTWGKPFNLSVPLPMTQGACGSAYKQGKLQMKGHVGSTHFLRDLVSHLGRAVFSRFSFNCLLIRIFPLKMFLPVQGEKRSFLTAPFNILGLPILLAAFHPGFCRITPICDSGIKPGSIGKELGFYANIQGPQHKANPLGVKFWPSSRHEAIFFSVKFHSIHQIWLWILVLFSWVTRIFPGPKLKDMNLDPENPSSEAGVLQ